MLVLSHNLSNNQANFKVNGTRFYNNILFFKVLYLHIVPTQETFSHKVTVSVEKEYITFRFSSKNL